MDIFFTKIDNEIESELQRDPLGEEEIWTLYANKLFNGVNSVTNELKGYVIASLIKDIIQKNEVMGNLSSRDYQIGTEIVIMLLMYKKNKELNKDVSFLGKNNLKSLRKDEDSFFIKRSGKAVNKEEKKEILVRQVQLGYYGRYHSKIEENYLSVLNAVFENNNELKEKIENWLSEKSEIIYNGIESKNILLDSDTEMEEALFQILKLENEKINNRLLEILKIHNNSEIHELYNEIKKLKENEDVNCQNIIVKTIEELKETGNNIELKDLLENIFYLEKFLVALENIFYRILDEGNLDQINNNYYKALRNSFNELQKFENDTNNELEKITFENSKYNNLANSLKLKKDVKEVEIALIKDHEIIMKKRKKAPWIEFQNNNIKITHPIKQDYKNNIWTHNYFITNVINIIRSTNQWK